jgi:D-alanine-D-alanine ligase
VAVLYGGTSSERDVSLSSGRDVAAALERSGVNCISIDVGQDIVERLETEKPDMAFIVLHGPGGEDGKIQAVLEFLGIPYTGSNHVGSAVAMDKLISKHIFSGEGLPTSDHRVLHRDSDWKQIIQDFGSVFVKPANEGSSYGVSFAGTPEELEQAYLNAGAYDNRVFAEKFLPGAEYSVTVLAGQVLPAIQIVSEGKFYDYEAKYLTDSTQYLCPAPVTQKDEQVMANLALKAFNALGCRDWGRVDLMADSEGHYFILEANTVPGMTDHSLVPMAAKAIGLSFDALVLEILQLAWMRHHG